MHYLTHDCLSYRYSVLSCMGVDMRKRSFNLLPASQDFYCPSSLQFLLLGSLYCKQHGPRVSSLTIVLASVINYSLNAIEYM